MHQNTRHLQQQPQLCTTRAGHQPSTQKKLTGAVSAHAMFWRENPHAQQAHNSSAAGSVLQTLC